MKMNWLIMLLLAMVLVFTGCEQPTDSKEDPTDEPDVVPPVVVPVVIDWLVDGDDFEGYTSTDQIALNYLNAHGDPTVSLSTTGDSNALEFTYTASSQWGNFVGVSLNNADESIDWSGKVLKFLYKGSADNTSDNIKIELKGAGDTPDADDITKIASYTTTTINTQTEEWTEVTVDFVVDLNYESGDASTMNTAQWLIIGIAPTDGTSYDGTILIDNITISDSDTEPEVIVIFESDDFEDYTTTDELKAVWGESWFGDDKSLSDTDGVDGTNAMELIYNTDGDGWYDEWNDGNWKHYGEYYGTAFEAAQDLTNKTVNFSVKGNTDNIGEKIQLKIEDSAGGKFYFVSTNTVTDLDSWTTFSIDLSSSTNADGEIVNESFDPTKAKKLLIIIQVDNGKHSGSIFIDNVAIVD